MEENEKGQRKKHLVEIGDEWIDVKYLMKMKRIQRYDDDSAQLRFGFLINDNVPDFYSLKDYEMFFDSEQEREQCLSRIKEKLQMLGVEII